MQDDDTDDQPTPKGDTGDVLHLILKGLVYLRPYWREHVLITATVLLQVAMSVSLPLSLKELIDGAIAHQDWRLAMIILGALTALMLLTALAEVVQVYVRAQFGGELKKDLRLKLFSHLQNVPISYYDTAQPGEITALFANEIITLRNAWRNLAIRGLRAVLQLAATLVTMLILDWHVTLVLAVVLTIAFRIQQWVLLKSEVADYGDKMADAQVAFAVQDNVASFGMIRAFGLAEQAIRAFKEKVLNRPGGPRTLKNYDLAYFLAGLKAPPFLKSMVVVSANIQQTLIYLAALCTGAWLALEGVLSVGTYSALLALFVSLGQSISNFSIFFQDLISAASALERIERVLQLESKVKDAPGAVTLSRLEGRISFDGVSFGYRDQELQLKAISFCLPGRGSVAFVGRSGCGKSTIMKLMLRFYDPVAGKVCIDGHDLTKVRLACLRGQIGVVMQELILFNGTIRDNIAVVKPDASDEEIVVAAEAAEIHETIAGLPQAYLTVVGEGGKRLSPGQRQRIALARALLCRPAILILDEITSALDPETEAAVQETLRKISRQRLVVLLTHRLSSVARMDKVVVLDRGVLVQQGSHHGLLQQSGLYKQFWQIQSGFLVSQDGRRAEISASRLQAIPLFAEIDLADLEQLARGFLTHHYEPGEMICSEGQVGDRFFIIVRGRVQVLASGRAEDLLQVAILEDGDYFGEDALLDRTTYTTGIKVEVPTLVLYLKGKDFRKMTGSTRRVRLSMEETAVARSLTLVGRRGRRPSRLSTWDCLVDT